MNISKLWSKIPKKVLKYGTIGVVSVVVIITVFISYLGLKPIKKTNSKSISKLSYQESKTKFESELASKDNQNISSECKSKLLDRNRKTEKVVIMFHGFTNCPAQFEILSRQLYDQGYNVLIPRIPYHGNADVLTSEPEKLTADELVEQIELSLSIATGLGSKINIFGLSGGAVMAAYAGYFYNEVKNVFIAAPIFTPQQFPAWQLPFLINLIDTLPSLFIWWDDKTKENIEGPKYAYPRFSLKAVKAFITLSNELKVALEKNQVYQEDKKLILLTTQNDPAVNNSVARYLIDLWSKNSDTLLISYQLSAEKMPIHDFIDPNQKKANIDYVYPQIINLLNQVN